MKIGIDFDDVVANSMHAILQLHNERYGSNYTLDHAISYRLEDVWGGTTEEAVKKIDEFFDTDQLITISPMAGSIKGLRALKSQGHELYIVTGRKSRDIKQTERWLEHHFKGVFSGIHYASFFAMKESENPLKKVDICKKLGIELMIDDNLPTALECATEGIKVFLFDQNWNRTKLSEGITRVHSWDEIVEKL